MAWYETEVLMLDDVEEFRLEKTIKLEKVFYVHTFIIVII